MSTAQEGEQNSFGVDKLARADGDGDLRGLWGGESFTTLASVEEEPVLPRGWWRASATKRRQRGEFKVCLYLAVAQHGNGGTAGLSEEVEVSLLCCSFLSQSYRQLGRFEAGKGVKLPVR